MRVLSCLTLALGLIASGGCDQGKTRETVTMAVVSNVLVATSGEAVGEPAALTDSAAARLTRIVEDLNADRNLRFVVFLGGLLGDGQARSLDPVKSALRELKKPYYVVLGPEGLPPTDQQTTTEVSKTTLGSDFLAWTFQGHGFDRPQPYWSADVGGGLVLVALHTAASGSGRPGHVDREQLQWLDATLTACRDRAVAVLSYHALAATMPYDNTFLWQRHMVDNAAEVLEVLNRHGNVTLVASASHAVSFGTVVGSAVHLRVPAVSIWPLSYNLVRLSPKEIERQNLSAGTADETRSALDRLAADETSQKLFGAGERNLEQLIQTFGGRKSELWSVSTLRP
jgi:hypothetical protein